MEVDPSGSDSWKLEPVIQRIKEGAVGVIPTDTVYVSYSLTLVLLFFLLSYLGFNFWMRPSGNFQTKYVPTFLLDQFSG